MKGYCYYCVGFDSMVIIIIVEEEEVVCPLLLFCVEIRRRHLSASPSFLGCDLVRRKDGKIYSTWRTLGRRRGTSCREDDVFATTSTSLNNMVVADDLTMA
jgi:hypothetical protein